MNRIRLLGAAIGATLIAGCADMAEPPPQAAVAAVTAERVAVVETVNATERSVLARGPDGRLTTVRVGPQVRNFAQIKPGDRIVTTVTDAVAVSMARPETRGATGSAAVATRAAAGQRPAASINEAERVRVRIESIDLGRNSATFALPNGERRTAAVRGDAMRRFLRTLSPGDMVDVVFLESYSLRVLPPA
jgi:translation initiation factor IF-1